MELTEKRVGSHQASMACDQCSDTAIWLMFDTGMLVHALCNRCKTRMFGEVSGDEDHGDEIRR